MTTTQQQNKYFYFDVIEYNGKLQIFSGKCQNYLAYGFKNVRNYIVL